MNGTLELLELIQTLEKIEGRKKLQKIVYVLQTQGHPFPQHFGYLHYGPYSSELASEIDALSSGDLIVQEKGDGQYQPFVYRPGRNVPNLLQEMGRSQSAKWTELAKLLNSNDANFLEALSTLLYLQRNGFQGKRLADRFNELKPNLRSLLPKVRTFADRHALLTSA